MFFSQHISVGIVCNSYCSNDFYPHLPCLQILQFVVEGVLMACKQGTTDLIDKIYLVRESLIKRLRLMFMLCFRP